MKKLVKITSVLSILIAAVCLLFGIRALTGRGFLVGFAFFSMVRSGSFFGFIGNILGIAVTCGGFGAMGFFGLASDNKSVKQKAFILGTVMSAVCLLSLICSIFARSFNIGDVIMLALPLFYTLGIIKSA